MANEMDFGVNQAFVEELYLRYRENPAGVSAEWRRFFEGHASAATAAPAPAAQAPAPVEPSAVYGLPPSAELAPEGGARGTASELQARVSALMNAYRVRGHLFAKVDPLGLWEHPPFELSLEDYGLDKVDPSTIFNTGSMAGPDELPLAEIVRRLNETYCRTIGAEFTFIENPEERRWLQRRLEETCNHIDLDRELQLRILTKLTDAETLELFLHNTYLGAKRFSVEGTESVIPLLDLCIEKSADLGVEEVVFGMAHRGRLNVLHQRPRAAPARTSSPRSRTTRSRGADLGSGDVKYHLGHSTDRVIDGHHVHMTLSFNPSHLEFVNPVVEGRVRAKQDRRGDVGAHGACCRCCIHGDAAFVGQGIVAETLNLGHLTRLQHGRHDPRGRSTTRSASPPRGVDRLALDALLHRHHADAPLPGLPRERRGPRRPSAQSRSSPPSTASASSATSSSISTATASTATTRATSRASRSR